MRVRQEQVAEGERMLAGAEGRLRAELERVAGLGADAAREELVAAIAGQARRDAAVLARRIEAEAREVAEDRARAVVVEAILERAAAGRRA